MSQLELGLQRLLLRRPEIARCYRAGLVNRRALARFLVAERIAGPTEFDAALATVRRHDFGAAATPEPDVFRDLRIAVRDKLVILDFEKERELLRRLERLIAAIEYDRGDTLKIVVGTESLKLFLDRRREAAVRPLFERFRLLHRYDRISEISVMFPESAIRTRGVLASVAEELALHDVVVTELLTASPELLLYLADTQVPRAYEVLRGLRDAADEAPARSGSARGGGGPTTRTPGRSSSR